MVFQQPRKDAALKMQVMTILLVKQDKYTFVLSSIKLVSYDNVIGGSHVRLFRLPIII